MSHLYGKVTLALASSLLVASLLMVAALAQTGPFQIPENQATQRFNLTINTPILNASTTNQTFNITIGNNITGGVGGGLNITHVELRLFTHEGYSFVNNSNATAAAFASDAAFNESANVSFNVIKEFLEFETVKLVWTHTSTTNDIIPDNFERSFSVRIGTPLIIGQASMQLNVTHFNATSGTYINESIFMLITLQTPAINAIVHLRGPANDTYSNTSFNSNNVPIQFNVTGDSLNYACLVFRNETTPFGKEFLPAPAPPNFTVPKNTNTNITVFMPFGVWEWNVKCVPKKSYVAIRTGSGWNVTVNGTGEPASLNNIQVGDFINFTNDLTQSIKLTFSPPFSPQFIVILNSSNTSMINNSILIDTAPDFTNIASPRPPILGPFVDNVTDNFNSSILGGFGNFGDPRFAPGVFALNNFTVNVTGPARPFIDPGHFFNADGGGFAFDGGPCSPSAPEPKPPFCFQNTSDGVNFDPNDFDFFEKHPDFIMSGFTDCSDPANVNKPDCKIIFDPFAEITDDTTNPNVLFTNIESFSDKIFVDFGTDEMTNMTLDYFGTNSYCGSAVVTIIDEGVRFPNGTLIQNSRFKPFHHFELSSITASNISISSNTTYYYKTKTCDRAGNCAESSSCKNLNSSTTSFAATPIGLNFTIPTGFNFKFNFPNGTSVDIGSTTNFANLTNVTMKFAPSNANWGIDLPASAIATASSFDFSNAFKSVIIGDRHFVGMNKTVWDGLAQRLGITAINMTIVGTGDTLFKCDDSGGNCKEVTGLADKVLTNTTAGTSTWTIPTTLGFSTYIDNPTVTTTAAATASAGGVGGGGASVSTTRTSYSKTFGTLLPTIKRTLTSGELAKIDTAVTQITILVSEPANDVQIIVSKLSQKPADVPAPSEKVYQYVDIASTLEESGVAESEITFKVPISWLSQNGVSENDVSLARYSAGAWSELATRVISIETADVTFEAETPGFSTFAIIAGGVSVAEEAPAEEAPEEAAPAEESPAVPTADEILKGYDTTMLVIIGVVVVAVIGGAVYFARGKRRR